MNRKRILLIAALVAASLTVLAFVALGGRASTTAPGGNVPPAAAAKTSFPGLAAAEGEPDLSGLQATRPSPGQVLQVQGPFDDRLVVESLAFDGQAATGAVRITSDVSDLLELQVLAGFYDDDGTFLGTARFVHHRGSEGHNHSGPPEEGEEFSIPVPAELKTKAVSAAVGVPVLVNE
ncbi:MULTISPECIES: hypothetical protein [unclassified Paenarthrobacter]|uniref:hypothetical protein n=1 Tax=unclassified Paenarthrobacter TaxID=2634190 RepID=UPI00084E9713|nr:hypothetical protein [Paenarthrobacter sp. R1]NKR10617.1 hypothetical protein [Arthrobacter sp. M5]NKR16457.1 hypothetical protein [Arthrobacter sp. M6]OEH61431.1 hypothetical protein A5N13_16965 [Arthrobacter sp. D4]OEH64417.1 hypothetical protein A5N17_06360 [Arthrobacter sp. D2]WIV29202.1 hypothetical protein QN084_12525 [Paenarthrobacter sp. R1]